ncbi:MAG: hypothetical protein WAM14_19570 [Candidatus Nitrosopolaris sp.]
MAVIAIDSSGIVGQPPVFMVAARLRYRPSREEWTQDDYILKLDRTPHDTFIGRDREWKLKLSVVLIYIVILPLFHTGDTIEIDIDFNPQDKEKVRRYLHKLFCDYSAKTLIKEPPHIYFRSIEDSDYIKKVDMKSKSARKGGMKPIERASESILQEYFGVLQKIT